MTIFKHQASVEANGQPLAVSLFAIAVLVSSSCKFENSGNSYQSMGRPGLPLGIPDELKNTAWKTGPASDGTPCIYYMAFTTNTRIDALECNGKVSYSEYLSGYSFNQAGEAATDASGAFPAGSPQYQLSSEGLEKSSCNRDSGSKTKSFQLEGHTFYAMLGTASGGSARAMKTWTRKASNSVAYEEVQYETAVKIFNAASCL